MTDTTDPYAGAPADDTTLARDFPVQGIDVSQHQGANFDWDAALEEGIEFGFTRMTIGGSPSIDIRAAENWAALYQRRDRIVRGAYHYAYPASVATTPEQDAIDEANWYCDQYIANEALVHDGKPGWDGYCLPPALDYEQTEDNTDGALTLTVDQQKAWVNNWIWTVQRRLQRGVEVYSGPNVWRKNFDRDDWLTGLPLWVAQYTSPSGRTITPWASWLIWQWSGGGNGDNYAAINGHVFPGASNGGSVDVNAFWGTSEQLLQLCDPAHDRWLNRDGTVGPNPHASGPSIPAPVPPPTPPAPELGPPPPISVDLADLAGQTSTLVMRVQGLLLSHGYGPDGLVGSNGRPDGRAGTTTLDALKSFKGFAGLTADTIVDWPTWWVLMTRDL